MSNQLVKKNPAEGYQNVFPKTFIDAIKDKESGVSLQEILQGFNMYFLSYNGSKALTRCKIPTVLRKEGLWITYVLYDHTVVTEWYNSDQIDDNSWSMDSNWRVASNSLVGDVSVSADGYWVINGEKTEAKAQGEQGVTPLLRVGANNKLQVSYNVGKGWKDISDYIVPRFRYTRGTTNDTAGIIQISMDLGKTWTNLSNEITNNLRISRYIGINESLPTSEVVEGTVYMKGPYYDEGDTTNSNPIYRMWVYAWKGDTLAWQDNGEFTSISAGVVQERGTSTTEIMSQDAVTRELTELELKNIYINGFGSNFNNVTGGVEIGEYYYNTNRDCIVQRVGEYSWEDIPLSKNTSYYHKGDLYIFNGEKLIKNTEDVEMRLDIEEFNTMILSSNINPVITEFGTISVDNGAPGDMSTRFRTKDFVVAPFSINMSSGYCLNYLYRYNIDGSYVDWENLNNNNKLEINDSSYIYKISFKRKDGGDINVDDLKKLTHLGRIGLIEKELSNTEDILDSIIEDVNVPIPLYSEINDSYLNSDGSVEIVDSGNFSTRIYNCKDIHKIKLEGTGGGIAYRYAFYKSSDLNAENAIEVGPQMSGELYSEILEVPNDAEFIAVSYRLSWEQNIFSIKKQVKGGIAKKSLKILCFGNSFTLGSMGYVPFLLKDHFKEDIDLTIGIAFISGGTLGPTYNGVENQLQKITEDTSYTYFKYVNDSTAWIRQSAKPSEMLADEDWDVITFQQGSNNAPDYSTYQPYLNECIDLISQKVSKPIKIAWLIPHADINVFTQGKEQGILNSAERVMDETITEVLIPYGTAIANARTTSLKEIGDAGNLLYEGKHLQNGLPMLVSNYCSMIVLLSLLGMNQKSIVGINSIEVNDDWVSTHNIPNASAVGNCVGVTSENCRIAEKCAIMAVKKPYTIMDL